MLSSGTKMPTMADKDKKPKRPKRRPHISVTARLDRKLGDAFHEHVETLRPKPNIQSIIAMLIEDWLKEAGKWPPPADA